MALYAVIYDYDERVDLRDQVRPTHRAFLRGLFDEGLLQASGPLHGGRGAGALLVLRADDAETVLARLDEDPYWTSRIVAVRTLREWEPVLGPWA